MIEIVLLRHAVAVERDEWFAGGRDDASRPLTDKGRARLHTSTLGLRTLVPQLGSLLCSPYRRTVETADVIAKYYPEVKSKCHDVFAPNAKAQEALDCVRSLVMSSPILVVGHEPNLSEMLSLLLGADDCVFTHFKKAGAASILFETEFLPGSGTLQWYIPPRLLRRLGKLKKHRG